MPEQLPASRRVAVLRAQRRSRPALRVPRLEVRRRRPLHRHAQRARRVRLSNQSQGRGVSDQRARRHRVGVSWPRVKHRRHCRTSRATCCPAPRRGPISSRPTGSRCSRATSTPPTSASCTTAAFSPKTFRQVRSRSTSSASAPRTSRSSTPTAARRTPPSALRTTGPAVLAHRAVDVSVVLDGAARRARSRQAQRLRSADGRSPHHYLPDVGEPRTSRRQRPEREHESRFRCSRTPPTGSAAFSPSFSLTTTS